LKTIRLAVLAAFLAALSVVVAAQQYPNLRGRVNDYANMLSSQEERQLNAKLAGFEAKTSIQIVIAIVDSLQGQMPEAYAQGLGNHWRIGQQDINNGIVILWYPQGRDYHILPGLGLKPDLTDETVGQIGRENLVPHFKQNRWATGLNQTVDAIISRLGEVSWADREAGRLLERERTVKAERERAEQMRLEAEQAELRRIEENKKVRAYASYIMIVVAVIGISVFGFVGFRNWNRKRLLQEDLRLRLAVRKQENAEMAAGLLNDLNYTLDRLALEKDKEAARQLHSKATEAASVMGAQIDELLKVVSDDPDAAKSKIEAYDFSTPAKFVVEMVGLAEQYSKALVEAPAVMSLGLSTLEATEKAISVLIADGYSPGHKKVFAEVAQFFAAAKAKYAGKPADPVESIRLVNLAIENLNAEQERCEGLPALKAKTDQDLDGMETKVSELRVIRGSLDFKDKARWIKSICSNTVWEQPLAKLETVSSRLEEELRRIRQARQLNSMEVQQFSEASTLAEDIQKQLVEIEPDLTVVPQLYDEQAKAKDEAASVVESAKKRVVVRAELVVHSDASASTGQAYSAAVSQVTGLSEQYSKKQVGDWVALVQGLKQGASAAEQAVRTAAAEIKLAAEEREKARKEKLQLAEKAERNRLNAIIAANAAAEQSRRNEAVTRNRPSSGNSFRPGGGKFGGGGAGGKY
jgi:uncharacterized membrane protein YgcG